MSRLRESSSPSSAPYYYSSTLSDETPKPLPFVTTTDNLPDQLIRAAIYHHSALGGEKEATQPLGWYLG